MPNKEDLLNHLRDHLPYEVKMLAHTYQRIQTVKDQMDWNAFLEAFSVHARTLIDFLTNDRSAGSTSFVASDFIPNFPAARLDQGQNNNITNLQTLLNQQIMHLGTKRTSDAKKKFDTERAERVFNWIKQEWPRFYDAMTQIPEYAQVWDTRPAPEGPPEPDKGTVISYTNAGSPPGASSHSTSTSSIGPILGNFDTEKPGDK